LRIYRREVRSPDFTLLWVSQTISEVGTRVSLFVLPLVTFAMTGSTLLAGLAGGLDLLGTALALLPAGLVADRCDRARVLRAAALAGALLYASVAVAALLGVLTVPHLFAVALLCGVATGFFTPAEVAAVRGVVPPGELPTALSRMQARQHVGSLVGGPLGGLLYAAGRAAPFLADALSYAVAWVLLGRLRSDLRPHPRPVPGRRRGARAEVAEGLAFVWSRRLFRTTLVWSMGANLTVNAVLVLGNLRLVAAGVPAWQIGLVGTVAGGCGLLGALVAPVLIARVPTGWLTISVAWSMVPPLVPLLWWNHPAVLAAALAPGFLLSPAGNAGMGSYKVAVTPAGLVGRVQSVGQFASWSTLPLAPVAAGALLTALGGPGATAVLLVACAGVALVPTCSRTVRVVPRPSGWPTPDQPDWSGAGGGQRLPAGPHARPEPDGPHGGALRAAGAAAGHP
jgi:MFS family permease